MSVQVADLVASLRGEDKNFTSLMATAALRVGNLHLSTTSAIGGVGALGVALTALAAGGLAASIKQAADFQSLTQKWANNAGLSAAGTVAMSNAVKQVAIQTGQSFDSLAHGYSTIVSHSFNAAQSLNVLTVAARNAAATGGDAYENAYMLSGILKEYGSSGQVAARSLAATTRVMDTLHAAVTNSAWSMNQFVEGSKKAIGVASQYDVPLATVTAELAALSQHGFANAANAGTAWSGMLTRLAAPTAMAAVEFKKLSATTGVDLVGDMKRLQSNGAFLPQMLADIRLAAEKTGLSMNQFISTDLVQLMPQKAYRQALAALLKYQDDVVATTAKTTAAAKGLMANGTDEAFAAQQKTLQGQLADLQQSFNVLAVTVGTAFIPVLTRATNAILPFVQLLTSKGIGPAMAKLGEDITGAFSRVDWRLVSRQVMSGLYTVFLSMQSWLQNTGLPFLQARLTDLANLFSTINWVKMGIDLKNGIKSALDQAGHWLDTTGVPWLHTQLDPIGNMFSQIGDIFKRKGGAQALFNALKNELSQGIKMFQDWLGTSGVNGWLHQQLDPLGNMFGQIGDLLHKKGGAAALTNALKQEFAAAIKSFQDWLGTSGVNGWLHQQLDPIGQMFAQIGAIWSKPGGADALTKGLRTAFTNAMGAAFGSMGHWLDTTGEPLLHKMLDPLGPAIGKAWSDAWNSIGNAGDAQLTSWGKGLVQSLINAFHDQFHNLQVNAKKYLADAVTSVFGDPLKFLYNIGADLVQGLIKGIFDHWPGWLPKPGGGGNSNPPPQTGGGGSGGHGAPKGGFGVLSESALAAIRAAVLPTSLPGAGLALSGPATVTVTTTVQVTGGANGQDVGRQIGNAISEFTRQMVQAQRGVTNTVPQSHPGAV